MSTHHSFESLIVRFYESVTGSWETNAYPRTLSFDTGKLIVPHAGYSYAHPLTTHARRQLLQFLSIPFSVFRDADAIAQENLFAEAMEQLICPGYRMLTLRGRLNEVRGIVDELCSPFDNLTLLRSLWHWRRRFQVQWVSIEECALHLRLIDPETMQMVLPDDYLIAGVHIASSEVGARPLTVEPLVYRLKCGNGLVGFGTTASTLSKVPRWTDGDIGAMLRQAVEEALGVAESSIAAVGETARQVVEKPWLLLKSIESPRYKGIIEATLQGLSFEDVATQRTLYGVMNAMTQVAQKYPPETRLRIEQMAGRIVPQRLT